MRTAPWMNAPAPKSLRLPFLLIPLLLAASMGAAAEATSPAPLPWAEINPLGLAGEPVTFEVTDPKAPVRWTAGSGGLALVCFGGEGEAVSCEQTYLEKSASVPPVLQKGVRITGVIRVGKALAEGAKVALVPEGLRSQRREIFLPLGKDEKSGKMIREVTSDAKGRFSTPQLAAGTYVFQVTTRDRRMSSSTVRVPRPEALRPGQKPSVPPAEPVLDIGEITFPEGVAVQAWVTAQDGRPLRGATVGARQGQPLADGRYFKVVTDAEGKATLVGLDPAERTRLTCTFKGFAPSEELYDTPPPVTRCALDPLARIEGAVTDEEDMPVAGATLSIRDRGELTATGRDGRFQVGEIGPGHYDLVIAAPGFRIERQTVDIAPGEQRKMNVRLEPGQEVQGLVRDARSQKPIAGASIFSVDPPGAVSATSDAEGAFDFSTADDGKLSFEVRAEGYPKTSLVLDPPRIAALAEKEEPLVVELKEGGRVHAYVWDEEADVPCQGCGVVLSGGGGTTLVTNAQGEAISEPLAEGEYNVLRPQVQSRGEEVRVETNSARRVQVVSGQTVPLRLGEPRPVLEVRFHPEVPDGWLLFAEAGAGPRTAERLPDGGFKVRKPAGGAVRLRLTLPPGSTWIDQAVLPADDTSSSIDLSLPQAGVSGLLVKDESIPVAGRRVDILAADGSPRAFTSTGEDGSFAVPFLPAGTYALVVDGRPLQSFAIDRDQQRDLGRIPLPASPAPGR